MKRTSWTKCLAARRCKQEAQPAGRSSVGAQSRVCQLPELDGLATQLGQLGINWTQCSGLGNWAGSGQWPGHVDDPCATMG
ncbi:hypothetical protein F2Q68_00006625 [Brassica cretica]|uniref:Uncharacterized protein n=1 Tax=Brassica cretica TaxID=69181 RepID=A0A8S9J680_BRACR|nr:hypothetical protein F2Q68_00006625 [Brassica cretica]